MIINFTCGSGNKPNEPPIWTYSGKYKSIEGGIVCTTDGNFSFSKLNKAKKDGITVILVGGGGGGGGGWASGSRGGAGYAGKIGSKVQQTIFPSKDKEYSITIGLGGGGGAAGGHGGHRGGSSTAFELAASGGAGGDGGAAGHGYDSDAKGKSGYSLYGSTYGSSGEAGNGWAQNHPAEPPGPGGHPPGHPAYWTQHTDPGRSGSSGTVIILGLT